MDNLFEFVDIAVTAGNTAILDGITATIPRGQLTVVAGASGSGKTSLLRLCNRLDVPTRGEVRYRGEDLSTIDPRSLRRQVGMVFQRPVLFPGTVRDNLLEAGDAAESEMVAALATVDLPPVFLGRIGDDLSGGEAQRVCLARALLCRPEVLLMDEPTSSLHQAAAATLETTTRHLHTREDVDVVWVTHDLSQISRLADYLLVLAAGRVAYTGPPDNPAAERALSTLTAEDG